VGLTAAKERLNAQLEREIELFHERRMAKLTAGEILKDGSGKKILAKAEEVAEEAENFPVADIISRIRDHQAEVMRACKTSSKLKGTHRAMLNSAAAWTLGF